MGSIEDAIRDIVQEELTSAADVKKESVSTLVNELVDERFEHLTEKDMKLVDERIDEKLNETDSAEQVAEHIDLKELSEHIDVAELAGEFEASDIASHIEAEDIAKHIDASDIASHISEADVAMHIDFEEEVGKTVDARLTATLLREHIANFFESEWGREVLREELMRGLREALVPAGATTAPAAAPGTVPI